MAIKIRVNISSFTRKQLLCSSFVLVSITQPSAANDNIHHDISFAERSRFASVQNDISAGKAASVLLRLTLKSQWNENISTTLEADGVKSFLNNEHSDGVTINNRPIIPDVPGAEINQAFVSLNTETLKLNMGRQRINFDNQRFIGGNAFWQNEQTFDAILARSKLLNNSSFTYAYLANVNRIFGEDANKTLTNFEDINNPKSTLRPLAMLGDHRLNSHLSRLEWNEWDYSQWVTYFYAIDNKDAVNLSNNTLGTSYNFNYKLAGIKYHLYLEAATQERTTLSSRPRLPYYLVTLSASLNAYEIGINHEILSANKQAMFITPLGSLHDFQGWANQATGSATQGIKDSFLQTVWRAAPFKIDARYHYFVSDIGSQKIGNEMDVDMIFKPTKKHNFSIRLANFTSATQSHEKNIQKVFLNYAYNL